VNYTFHIVDVFSSTPFGGNQRSCEQLGAELEARTGVTKPFSTRRSARLRHDDDDGDRTGARVRKSSSKGVFPTRTCPNGTIIVIIMNLWNFRFGINTSATFVEEALWKISSPICVMLREHL
jgi:hypothetical protein